MSIACSRQVAKTAPGSISRRAAAIRSVSLGPMPSTAQIAGRGVEHGRGGAKAVAQRPVQSWSDSRDQRQSEGIEQRARQRFVRAARQWAVAAEVGRRLLIPRWILVRHLGAPFGGGQPVHRVANAWLTRIGDRALSVPACSETERSSGNRLAIRRLPAGGRHGADFSSSGKRAESLSTDIRIGLTRMILRWPKFTGERQAAFSAEIG